MAHASWGSGWPNCQGSRINKGFYVDTRYGRVTFPGGIRNEISELVSRLVKETTNRGYRFGIPGNPSYGCWGYNCRAISGTRTASNHSWGLAVDINAPRNPYTYVLKTDMPGWMPDLWNAYGFRWGGDYSGKKDAMHYEFMGSMADAARLTLVARKNHLGEARTPTPIPPKPQPPKPPTPRKVTKVYTLMKGNESTEWWLTDMMTKRHMKSREEANFFIFHITANGGTVARRANNEPEAWDQAFVDNIERSDSAQEVDNVLRYYAAAKGGPMHEIVKQVLRDDLQETPDAG